jgi:hypothetical protein
VSDILFLSMEYKVVLNKVMSKIPFVGSIGICAGQNSFERHDGHNGPFRPNQPLLRPMV